jgi:hypothetical protein
MWEVLYDIEEAIGPGESDQQDAAVQTCGCSSKKVPGLA